MEKKTVHIIANAHLDPVWLWPWQAGLDEVLATGNTMCNLLDDYPRAIFTAGEAWRYEQIERVDPRLFQRIQHHVERGQWALTGGWWIQPDCNLPSGFAMRRQIQLGREYFLSRFGRFPEVAYNVDSFGHAASLPALMHEAGQRYYVMMRPGAHEMTLPARLFHWQGTEDGPSILTFRIANSYATWTETPTEGDIRSALSDLPAGVTHTMCFMGVGDHGGGPTARMLDWVMENEDRFEGVHLTFSSPDRFFAAVTPQAAACPVVTGELQYHAVGCYSVHRGIKTRVRRAEHRLDEAQRLEPQLDLTRAWRTLAFNHFHDILGGTSNPSASAQQCEELGGVISAADEVIIHHLRRKVVALPDDPRQRIILMNPNAEEFSGYVECEPWLRKNDWTAGRLLLGEDGASVPYQAMDTEMVNQIPEPLRLLFAAKISAGAIRTFRLSMEEAPATASPFGESANEINSPSGFGVRLADAPTLHLGPNRTLPLPPLQLDDDPTDNWSHGVDRFPCLRPEAPEWEAPFVMDNGPLMAARGRHGSSGQSLFHEEWRTCLGEPYVELILRVHWAEKRRILKLVLPLPGAPTHRTDGIMDGSLRRPSDGRESPLRDWSCISLNGADLAIVSPDVFALDCDGERVRLTLLRSPILTQHDPFPILPNRAVFADQGEHLFRIRFYAGKSLTPETLDRAVLAMHRPPLFADYTRGMPR